MAGRVVGERRLADWSAKLVAGQAASVALWVSIPIAVMWCPASGVPMDAGPMGSRAFSESCSYKATSDPLDR